MYCFIIFIILNRAVGAPGKWKDLVYGLNDRDKRMIKPKMENILNPELIRDNPKISSSCRFMKTNKIKI